MKGAIGPGFPGRAKADVRILFRHPGAGPDPGGWRAQRENSVKEWGQKEWGHSPFSALREMENVPVLRAQMLQRFCRETADFWYRCKRAALLYDWIEGVPIDVYSRADTPPRLYQGAIWYGDIARIAEATRFHLRSAHQILSVLFLDNSDFLHGVDEVLQRLEFGLPSAALPLTKLPIRLDRGHCLLLLGIGVQTPDQLSALNDNDLRNCIGIAPAIRLRLA